MIYVKKHRVKLKGKGIILTTELTMLLRAHRRLMTDSGLPVEVADGLIDECVRASRMTGEELDDEIARLAKELAEKEEAEE